MKRKISVIIAILTVIAIVYWVLKQAGIGYAIFAMCVSVFWLLYFIFATGKRGVKKYVSVNGLFGSRAFCIIINSCAILAAFPTYRYLLVNILLSILAFILIYFFRHKKAEYRKKNVLDIQLIGFINLNNILQMIFFSR